MSVVLQRAGFGVETAVSLLAAREQLQTKQFDLILLDLDLSGESGLPLISEVRTFHADTQTIILSAQISTTLQQKAFRNGARGYLVKPLDPIEIIIFVRSLLAGHCIISTFHQFFTIYPKLFQLYNPTNSLPLGMEYQSISM